MSIAATIGSVKTAVETLGKLRDITKSMQNAELKSTIAQLANELADTQLKLADLKQEIITLKDENQALKAVGTKEIFTKKWGCYVFEADTELYCSACYASKGKKSPTTRLDTRFRQCTVCKAMLGG